jgi:hypothetical protein
MCAKSNAQDYVAWHITVHASPPYFNRKIKPIKRKKYSPLTCAMQAHFVSGYIRTSSSDGRSPHSAHGFSVILLSDLAVRVRSATVHCLVCSSVLSPFRCPLTYILAAYSSCADTVPLNKAVSTSQETVSFEGVEQERFVWHD